MATRNSDQAKLDSAQLQALASSFGGKGTRKQSEYVFLGLPLYSIAVLHLLGPAPGLRR